MTVRVIHTFWANILTYVTHTLQPTPRVKLEQEGAVVYVRVTGLVKHPARRVIWIILSAKAKLQPNMSNPLTGGLQTFKFFLGFIAKSINHFMVCEYSAHTARQG